MLQVLWKYSTQTNTYNSSYSQENHESNTFHQKSCSTLVQLGWLELSTYCNSVQPDALFFLAPTQLLVLTPFHAWDKEISGLLCITAFVHQCQHQYIYFPTRFPFSRKLPDMNEIFSLGLPNKATGPSMMQNNTATQLTDYNFKMIEFLHVFYKLILFQS